jgi:hypothetical protein
MMAMMATMMTTTVMSAILYLLVQPGVVQALPHQPAMMAMMAMMATMMTTGYDGDDGDDNDDDDDDNYIYIGPTMGGPGSPPPTGA